MKKTLSAVATAGLLLYGAFVPTNHADTVTVISDADTTLFENNPNNNLGGVNSLAAGSTARNERSRALFRFDTTDAIPAGATVTGATVRVTVTKTPMGGGASSTFELRRVLRFWNEGQKTAGPNGSAASSGEASWTSPFFPVLRGDMPGGISGTDFAAMASATQFVAGQNTYTFASTPELVSDVQSWFTNETQNFGWMLLTQSEGTSGTARRFGSREGAANQAPTLVIDFIPPGSSGALLVGARTLDSMFAFDFIAEANEDYTVEFRDSLSIGGWQTLTNFPAAETDRMVTVTDLKQSAQRFYRVSEP